jgi:predicted RNA methylase
VLRALSVKGNELVDFGAGSGRVILSAVAEGASRSYGYELPENKGMRYIFDAMLIAPATLTQDRVEWIGKDI